MSDNQQVGVLKKWEENDWSEPFNPGSQFYYQVFSPQTILGDQTIQSSEKYNNWNFDKSDVRNHHTFTITSETSELTSRFEQTFSGITFRNSLEGSSTDGGNVEFRDPWFIDFPDPAFGNQLRNRGMNDAIYYQRPSPFNPTHSGQYKGVFLNQTPDPQNPNKPYYKVGMLEEQTISVNGQQRKFFPYKWTGTDVNFQNEYHRQTGVVFTSSNAEATAILKGQLMSNDQNAISSASQRKIVRTDNGRYHVVYESMSTVWYAHSATSDFYGAWYPDQLMLEKGKNPAIAYDGNIVKVVCEEYDPQYGGDANIWVLNFEQSMQGGWYENTDAEIIASYPNSYYGNAKPVISYTTGSSTTGEIFVAYRKNPTEGIKQRTRFYNFGNWSNWTTEADITGTNSYSINPAVIGQPGYIHIAYEYLYGIYYKFGYRQ